MVPAELTKFITIDHTLENIQLIKVESLGTRDHSAPGAVDKRTGNEPIYVERFSLIYPSFNAYGLMSVFVILGNINFFGLMSVYVNVGIIYFLEQTLKSF